MLKERVNLMEGNTKQAIIDYVIAEAEKKPLRKITIGEVGKAVGITRNSFYYYFKDIYDVLDQAILSKLSVFEECGPGEDDKALFDVIEFTVMYKKVWINLYKTVGQEKLRSYVIKRLHGVFLKYINAHLDGYELSEIDQGILSTYFEEAIFGVLVRWVRGESRGNTPQEMHEISERIRVVFKGCLDLMLDNIKENP